MLKQFLNDEHLKNAAQIAVTAFFIGFVIEIIRALLKLGEPFYLQFHALVGAGIGSYFWSKNGKRGVVYAIVMATAFNIIWELFEAYALNWTQPALNLDTKVDITLVYLSMLFGFGVEELRKRLNNK